MTRIAPPPNPCTTLAEALAASDASLSRLPSDLPCSPLDVLIALHRIVVSHMIRDRPHAIRAAEAARAVANQFSHDALLDGQAHWSMATALLYAPNYERSLAHYDAALACYTRAEQEAVSLPLPRDIRVVHIVRIFCLSELGRYQEAQVAVQLVELWLQERPEAQFERLTYLLNRSQLAGRMGAYALMVDLADQTYILACTLEQPHRAAEALINRGHACVYLGYFAEAEAALEKGMTIAREAGEALTVARGMWNIARLRRAQGHLFAALEALHEAEVGFSTAEGESATVAFAKAEIFAQLRHLPEAQVAARHAASLYAQLSMPVYSAAAALYGVRIALDQRQPTAARSLFAMAHAQSQTAGLPVLDAEITLAMIDIALHQPVRGSQRTRRSQLQKFHEQAEQAAHTLRTASLAREAVVAELLIAALDAELGDVNTACARLLRVVEAADPAVRMGAHNRLGNLLNGHSALVHHQRAVELAIEQRRKLPTEVLQSRYSSEVSPYHLQLAACYLSMGRVVESLETIWSAKVGPMLDLNTMTGTIHPSTQALIDAAKMELMRLTEQELEHRRSAWMYEQQGQHDSARFHNTALQHVRTALEACEQRLTESLQTHGQRYGVASLPSLNDVQTQLPPQAILLEFACFGDQLICFALTAQGEPRVQTLGSLHNLEQHFERWKLVCHRFSHDRTIEQESVYSQIQQVLQPIWAILIAPWKELLEGYQQIIIAPYDILHHLPWAALSDGQYSLADTFSIALTPGGGLLGAEIKPLTTVSVPRIVAFSGVGDQQLSYVEEEVIDFQRSFARVDVFNPGTSADLRAALAPQVLHISAHARTDAHIPLCSTIELADGPFLLLEAHRLNLRGTQLVTLSACETGVFPVYGDMALALAGAFLCSGAATVVASLWRVSDEVTSLIMGHFYAALADGLPFPEALRRAQLHARTRDALHWAAFQLWVGVGARLDQPLTRHT